MESKHGEEKKIRPFLSVQNATSTAATITANGTVLYAGNPVSCNLIPINADGTYRQTPDMAQTLTATVTGNNWTVTFNAPSGTTYSGWYLLTTNAVQEGSSYYLISL